jgi:hypothetical protein
MQEKEDISIIKHMVLLYHFWAFIQRNASQHKVKIPALLCLQQYLSKYPSYEINLNAQKPMNGQRKFDILHNRILFSHREE